MSKPQIDERIGGYDFTWEAEKVKISVTRIKEHRDNRVTIWLVISSTKTKGASLLHQAEFNLASSRTMKELVNFMGDKYDAPWDTIIEQLRFYILERVRQGEPVMALSTEDADIEPPTYLVNPLLPEHQPTIMFGDPGVGKSYISLLIYICLLLPWHDNPFGLTVPDHSFRPLILDYETDHKTALWRLRCLQEGMGLPPLTLYYRRCYIRIADDLEQIQVAMDEVNTECLIIDSLAQACGGDLLKADIAGDFFSALRKLNTTSFIIAQNQKDPELKKKSIFGSAIYEYYSRSIWEAKKAQTAGEDEIHIALHHRKSNESKLYKPTGYRFYFNEDKTTITRESLKDVPEFRQEMKTQDKVFYTLQELGRADTATIAEAGEFTEAQVKASLSRLKDKNKVINFKEDHTWGIITKDYE